MKKIEKRTRIIPDEFESFKRLITEIYPSGIISIVGDTFNIWSVLTEILPRLKKEIEARDGRVVIRPDSGDPADIVCGLNTNKSLSDQIKSGAYNDGELNHIINNPSWKGVHELLWDIFGGTTNDKGFKVLNTKVGVIYGDAITLGRQKEILARLESKGFCASNLVLGIGSFTYNFNTRDTFGFAMKATYGELLLPDGTIQGKEICVSGDDPNIPDEEETLIISVDGVEQEYSLYGLMMAWLNSWFGDGKLAPTETVNGVEITLYDNGFKFSFV